MAVVTKGVKNVQRLIQDAFEDKIDEIEQQAKKQARSVIWIILKELQPVAEAKLKEIVQQEIYNQPERDYYERTGAFLESATVKITQGGGHYVLQVFFDPNVLSGYSGINNYIDNGFWSYAYTFGDEANRELNADEYQWLINTIAEEGIPTPNGMYRHNNIKDRFEKWLQQKFQPLFAKKFRSRFKNEKMAEPD